MYIFQDLKGQVLARNSKIELQMLAMWCGAVNLRAQLFPQ